MSRAVLILIAVAAVSACARKPVEVAPVAVPPALLNCPAAPAKPSGDYTQRDVGVYVIDLHAAHADCKSKVDAIRGALGPKPATR